MNMTIPTFIRIAEAMTQPIVTLRLPSIDDTLDETLRTKKQREETQREYQKPIEDVTMYQNMPRCNKECEFNSEG